MFAPRVLGVIIEPWSVRPVCIYAGRPGGVSGYILEPGIGRFGEFESVGVYTRIISWGLFLVHKLTCGKRDSVS